jgi:hypothetical protein
MHLETQQLKDHLVLISLPTPSTYLTIFSHLKTSVLTSSPTVLFSEHLVCSIKLQLGSI